MNSIVIRFVAGCRNYIFLFLISTVVFCYSCSQKQQETVNIDEEWSRMNKSKNQSYEEYNDLKFGMFIHWGVYSKLAGIWKGENIPKLGEWIMYHAEIPKNDYREVAKTFNPEGFNADEWVQLAKAAGMRYIVITSKHHDGFALFNSDVNDFNLYDFTEFKRDAIEELYNACKRHGIRLGLYYSHSIDWMDGGDAGYAQAIEKDPAHSDNYGANLWDPAQISYEEYIEKKAKPQVEEILTKYPDLIELWYDFPRFMNKQQSFEFYKLAYELQPECLINSRVGNDLGDFLVAGDNEIPTPEKVARIKTKTWETPGTLNNTWGYKSYDVDYKSPHELIFWITSISSKGGNYLLNVGPDGNGEIPPESQDLLLEIGQWMDINGEAVYGTHRWKILKEGPEETLVKSTTSREKEGFKMDFTEEDFWFTKRGDALFVTALIWPEGRKAIVKSLGRQSHVLDSEIASVQLLGAEDEHLSWSQNDDALEVVLSEKKPSSYGYVLKIILKREKNAKNE